MEVFAARQPIFNRMNEVFGYELLYRRSDNNFFEAIDDNQATAELINNAFIVLQFGELTDGTKAFINFSEKLLENEIPLLLPKEIVVVEILERVKPTPSVIRACRRLKEYGYTIALDDFVFDESYQSLIEIADIIKVEFPAIDHAQQRLMIQHFKQFYNTVFLAEKIETREEYEIALELGYDLFQGYYFSKPVMVKGKEIGGLRTTFFKVIEELDKEEPDYQVITEIVEKDIDLTYKLLKGANSLYFGSLQKVTSIKQAVVRFGFSELRKWMYLLSLKDIQTIENRELIKNSLIRGKMMELIAIQLKEVDTQHENFLIGLFSSVDVLLNKKMEEVLATLPLTPRVKQALLDKETKCRQMLELVLHLEKGEWEAFEHLLTQYSLPRQQVMELYIQAMKWTLEFD